MTRLTQIIGTGKTVMTLTLIMATLHQLSAPEESMIDVRPVLTPLSLRYFPSGEMAAARDRLMRSRRQKSTNIPTLGVPSLPELLLHQMCTKPDETVWEHRMRPDSETDNTLQIYRANTNFGSSSRATYRFTIITIRSPLIMNVLSVVKVLRVPVPCI